ncbi:endonuclease/exonuclease/phosphatase family protein [Colwellia sp. 6_MG-2023]|uniref:endonuclease/exonuclease/phosphatase family protein n=1 Tax=Colwellia sp. 6_MG-2023 TaxID=3062676 RepID=UPI0026E1DF47|nr:endonuclease/exonuclease/phosphatase family protein [Colwellia sp. 6_MG-2023]MDO6488894.1 endonuclease/exonuclease/phosphatase family protein [Colwellia sp. 6_MG-2023]
MPFDSPSLTSSLANTKLKFATFNLFNYLEPPNAAYEFERIFSAEQWQKKQRWISEYLDEYRPDIIGFQEVFSPNSLKELVASQGYQYFAVVDQPQVIDDFIYQRPVVAIASRYPIIEVFSVEPNIEFAQKLGLTDQFSFSRRVLRATIEIPHLGNCDCYVVHFKSKRSMIELNEHNNNFSPEQTIIESLKAQIAGSWGSTVQRGSEATLLMMDMIQRREETNQPMVLMGDFNNTLADGVLSHILTNTLRFVSTIDRDAYLAKYCLHDAWDLYQAMLANEGKTVNKAEETRPPTHYFGASSSVLDYILLSCEFDANYHDSLYAVSAHETYDRHLINPIFERDGESIDHGVVLVSLTLRS